MEKVIGIAGMLTMIGIAFLLSNNRKHISWRLVGAGIGLQLVMALLIFKVPLAREFCELLGDGIQKLLDSALDGAAFVVGEEVLEVEGCGELETRSPALLIPLREKHIIAPAHGHEER